MKAQDTKRAFKPNFPNFPTKRPKGQKQNFRTVTNLVSKRAKFNVDFENNWLFRKTSLCDEKLRFPLIVWKLLTFFSKQTRIGIIPTRKADPNIFLIALKQDYIDGQYVKLPYSMWPFFIFYVLLRKRRQNVQKLDNFKGVYVTRRDADQISWPFVKRDFDMLRILNLHIRA